MSTTTTDKFQQWCFDRNLDQERWTPTLLRVLKARYERSMEKLVIDGTGCEWPTKVYRVSETKEVPR
jgi:hypothetical protein